MVCFLFFFFPSSWPRSIFFSAQVISPPLFVLSLDAHRSELFLFSQVNALECALYLGSAAQTSLAGAHRSYRFWLWAPVVIQFLLLLPWPTGCSFFLEAPSLCSRNLACCRPSLADKHCFRVIKGPPETYPIKGLLCRFKWCWRCVGLHRLFWLPGLLSASLCENILALNDGSKDE